MGKDLLAIKDEGHDISYNSATWEHLVNKLMEWNVDVREFSFSNDGDFISPETCQKVADAIEAHLPELTADRMARLGKHVPLWRTCGGYQQH